MRAVITSGSCVAGANVDSEVGLADLLVGVEEKLVRVNRILQGHLYHSLGVVLIPVSVQCDVLYKTHKLKFAIQKRTLYSKNRVTVVCLNFTYCINVARDVIFIFSQFD